MAGRFRQNEAALVAAAQHGDREAVRLLLVRNWDWLKGLVWSVLAGGDGVDDVLQDICVQVIGGISDLRQAERFRPWLAVIARRCALRFAQRDQRRPLPLDYQRLSCHEDATAEKSFEEIETEEECRLILDSVRALPDKYRQVFMLVYCGQLSYAEAAQILDIPLTTVQIRLVRARQMVYEKVTGKNTDKAR